MPSFLYIIRPQLFRIFISALIIFMLQLHIGNPGGTAKNLPQTAIVWGVMSFFALGVLWRTRRTQIVYTPTTVSFLMATILLWLPWFFTRPEWKLEGLWPLLGLSAGMIFYISVLQYQWSIERLHRVLKLIIITTLLQAILVLLQMAWPGSLPDLLVYPLDKMMRPAGVFQQVNLLASFTATGLVTATLLYFSPAFKIHSIENWIINITFLILPMLLVILQSRVGSLGAIFSISLLLLYFGNKNMRKTLTSFFIFLCGISLGYAAICLGPSVSITHENSNFARSIMFRETLSMILERPWLGWGYGGFEYNFQHFRLDKGESTMGVGIATHPHNEFLYRWVEGGVMALVGMLFITLTGVYLYFQAYRQDQRTKIAPGTGIFFGLGSCLIPLLLHTQTEYPFYLSALHWGLFLLLLSIWDRLITTDQQISVISNMLTCIKLKKILAGAALATLLFTTTGGYSGWLMWRFEKLDFKRPLPHWQVNPWLLSERVEFDEQVSSLLEFNNDYSNSRLENYVIWAKKYLCSHVDREVYAHLVQALYVLKQHTSAEIWGSVGYRFFPDDPRFHSFSALPNNHFTESMGNNCSIATSDESIKDFLKNRVKTIKVNLRNAENE